VRICYWPLPQERATAGQHIHLRPKAKKVRASSLTRIEVVPLGNSNELYASP